MSYYLLYSTGLWKRVLTGSNVSQDSDLGGDLDVAEQESPEEGSEWTFIPLVQRIKDEFIASICISEENQQFFKECMVWGTNTSPNEQVRHTPSVRHLL